MKLFPKQTAGSAAGLVLAVLALTAPAFAQNSNGLPDAQIEANVLRALASAPELSSQNIQSLTVYGTVTLTGTVHDDALRTKAENLAARAQGVTKVVDQLALGDIPAETSAQTSQMSDNRTQADSLNGNVPQGQVLLSDGTYGPADGAPASNSAQPPPADTQPGSQSGYSQAAPQQPQPAYPQQQPYGPPPQRRPMYQNYNAAPSQGGQQAGLTVTVPQGAVLRIRINRGLDSNHIQPGTPFDGTILTDVVADGAVAIPRGATVQGTVIDARKAGVFKGQGELSLQINNLTLGGSNFALASDVWQRDGRDKTASTVNSTVGLAALGAVLGAVAGGGEGAAIGAGVGGAAGVAGSAASPRGQIIIPPESVLTFHLAQPATVRTVSEQEMARLSYAAGPGQPQPRPVRRRYSPYYGPYNGPAY